MGADTSRLFEESGIELDTTPDNMDRAFTCFPHLPSEIRLLIWTHVCSRERILEVCAETHQRPDLMQLRSCYVTPYNESFNMVHWDGMNFLEHQRYTVTRESALVPPVLQVNQESRGVALTHYHLRQLTWSRLLPADFPLPPLYYNPQADIIYFGEQTCISTVVHFTRHQNRQSSGPEQAPRITRIACEATRRMVFCCDWSTSELEVDSMGGPMPRGATVLNALRGMPEQCPHHRLFPGFPGLQEVIWVVPTNYLPENYRVDSSTTLRAPSGRGVAPEHRCAYDGLHRWMARQVVHAQNVRERDARGAQPKPRQVAASVWSRASYPLFTFRSLAANAPALRLTDDGLAPWQREVPRLRAGTMLSWYEIQHLVRRDCYWHDLTVATGCEVTVCERTTASEEQVEIGFLGTRRAIVEARAHLVNDIARIVAQRRQRDAHTHALLMSRTRS